MFFGKDDLLTSLFLHWRCFRHRYKSYRIMCRFIFIIHKWNFSVQIDSVSNFLSVSIFPMVISSDFRMGQHRDDHLGRLYGRAKRRPVNRTTKQSSELNSVGPETPKLMKFFWVWSLPVMTSSPLIRLQRPLPPCGDAISENENRTL